MTSTSSPSKEDLAKAIAYRDSILTKLESDTPLTCAEKRFCLRTGKLPYKALAFPLSLTPAERNRIRYSPPPAEVTANILKASNGALSTPSELYAKVLRDPGSLNSSELKLLVRNMHLPGSLWEQMARRRWTDKYDSRAWHLAYNKITTEEEIAAHRAAVRESMREERNREREREHKERVGPLETSEQIDREHAEDRRLMAEAKEKERMWDDQDEVLWREVKAEMNRMADEMGDGPCCCGKCEVEGEEGGDGDSGDVKG